MNFFPNGTFCSRRYISDQKLPFPGFGVLINRFIFPKNQILASEGLTSPVGDRKVILQHYKPFIFSVVYRNFFVNLHLNISDESKDLSDSS